MWLVIVDGVKRSVAIENAVNQWRMLSLYYILCIIKADFILHNRLRHHPKRGQSRGLEYRYVDVSSNSEEQEYYGPKNED